MEIASKYELIQSLILRANELADARGVDKCVAIVDIVQKLSFLEKLLKDEDFNHDSAIKELTKKLEVSEYGEGLNTK